MGTATGKPYLSVCAIYRDEGPYLREWVEFHRLVGVERFFLYDNGSVDDHLEALAPHLEQGVVTRYEWPTSPGQIEAYQHCLDTHRDDSRWIAFLDLDEFLFSPTGRPVPEVLADYEQWPAVLVNWAVFGTSGHRTMPPGLVIENYLLRSRDDHEGHRLAKSILDPTRALTCLTPHFFNYRDDARAVDELERPVRYGRTKSVSFSRLRINHYWFKSEEEILRKLRKGKADKPETRDGAISNLPKTTPIANAQRDDTITMYVPALREALAQLETSPRPAR